MESEKILIIANEPLLAIGSAGNTVMCGLVEEALDQGKRVTYIALVNRDEIDSGGAPQLLFFENGDRSLIQQDWSCSIVRVGRWKRFIGAFDMSYVAQMDPDAPSGLNAHYERMIAFDSLAISIAMRVSSDKHIAILGDPAGRKVWHSASWKNPVMKLKALLSEIAELIHYGRRIPRNWKLAMFGTAHSRFWSRILRRCVMDLRPFMPKNSKVALDETLTERQPIVTFGGTLAGTASRLALNSLTNDYLPALRKRYGRNNFEVRLIGQCPDGIASRLKIDFPEVKIIGRVPSFEQELANGIIFLLPMNYPVGVRTRICSALAAGCVCIVHRSVLNNMPELQDCSAVMVAKSAEDFIRHINSVPSGEELLVLRKQAQSFFDKFYAAASSAAPLFKCQ